MVQPHNAIPSTPARTPRGPSIVKIESEYLPEVAVVLSLCKFWKSSHDDMLHIHYGTNTNQSSSQQSRPHRSNQPITPDIAIHTHTSPQPKQAIQHHNHRADTANASYKPAHNVSRPSNSIIIDYQRHFRRDPLYPSPDLPPSSGRIRLNSSPRPHYTWDPSDLAASWDFVTIPAQDTTVPYLTITHATPVDRCRETGLIVGERHRVSLTERGLGARWWGFGSLDAELKGLKLKQQRRLRMSTTRGEGRQDENAYGEKPEQLNLLVEGGGAEFDVVSAHPNQ